MRKDPVEQRFSSMQPGRDSECNFPRVFSGSTKFGSMEVVATVTLFQQSGAAWFLFPSFLA